MKHATLQPLVTILNAIEEQTKKLSDAAAVLEVTRNFTLDGRLVGDIGEMLAAQYLDIQLDETQRRGHDGFANVEGKKRDVQIKCRKAANLIGLSSVPDLLVIIAFDDDWKNWEIVYNGEGTPVRLEAERLNLVVDEERRIRRNGQRTSLDLSLDWFRKDERKCFQQTRVPERSEPVPIFPRT